MNPTANDLVEVLLPRPFDHGFDYLVPGGMQIAAGDYVSVPFGKQQMLGVVWGAGIGDVPRAKCKPLLAHHASWPAMPEPLRKLIDRTADYTLAPRGMVLKMAMPNPKAWVSAPTYHVLRVGVVNVAALSPKRRAVLEWLSAYPGCDKSTLMKEANLSAAMLRSMLATGEIIAEEHTQQPVMDAYQFASPPTLTTEQQEAATQLALMQQQGFGTLVLDGVTGSGKTEIYFDAIERVLRDPLGGQVVVLLPEIALTVQWLERFTQRFGRSPHVWHSGLSEKQRRQSLQAILTGAARLVVGARSALFLPYANLKLIVVDEEHEPTYKQEEGVCYQARDMAVLRASLEEIPIVLASATPSLETLQNVSLGKYSRAVLPSRFGPQDLPAVTRIDMRQEQMDNGTWLSPSLREAMVQTLADGAQSLLFLNRRGYAPLLLCRHCGHRFQCPDCSAWMVMHQHPPRLHCHHCDKRQPMPSQCPACDAEADQLVACGPGVERLAEEVKGLFPDARLAVLTSDETNVAAQLEAVMRREVDILIGTQLVAKGHHFPHLALVGVIDADLGLVGGDLRAAERTYQLLHQVAGRAGREAHRGRVLLQTVQPQHPVMEALASWDRDGFVAQEMRQREAGGWPPFCRLVALVLEGPNEQSVAALARTIILRAPKQGIRVLGPAPAPLARLRGRHRYRLLVKASKSTALQAVLREWLSQVHLPSQVNLRVDVDPYYFL